MSGCEPAKTKHGIRFAEAGLDVVYDEESRRQYIEATTDDDEFERYIEKNARFGPFGVKLSKKGWSR